jgi:cysteine rich repeat protein
MVWKSSLVVAVAAFIPTLALAEPGNSALQSACGSDIKALCGSVQPGGGRIRDCMKQHSSQLSAACKAAAMAGRWS